MPFETFLDRLKVKVTLEGRINELFWAITPIYICMNFKIILHRCSP